jgi:hypothetical protein
MSGLLHDGADQGHALSALHVGHLLIGFAAAG